MSHTIDLFTEWSPGPYHTAVFTSPDKLPYTGFRSVYMYDKETVDHFTEKKSVVGADQFEVYSDTLFIDFDNQPAAVNELAERLRAKKIGFQIWESGGKGHHFHIPLSSLQVDKDLPAIHKTFLERTRLPVDSSIYRHNGLFRLPGAIHQKTRKPKILSFESMGCPLDFDLNKYRPTAPKYEKFAIDDSVDTLAFSLLTLSSACVNNPKVGNRYLTLWKLAMGISEAGLSDDVALELLEAINDRWENPKEQEEVERAIREAYTR